MFLLAFNNELEDRSVEMLFAIMFLRAFHSRTLTMHIVSLLSINEKQITEEIIQKKIYFFSFFDLFLFL